MASPATQVLFDPPYKFYSAEFEASSSAHAVLTDPYDHFVTAHFDDTLHCHYAITLLACQLAANFEGETLFRR